MNVNYDSLESSIYDGSFSQDLEQELTVGFRQLMIDGERLPPASHYAAQIAEIVSKGAEEPLSPELAFNLYQEVLLACERARATVLGE